jgi:lipopolysaccharide export system protein LptA
MPAAMLLALAGSACSSKLLKAPPQATGVQESKGEEINATADTAQPPEPKESAVIEPLRKDPPKLDKKAKKKRGRFQFSGDEFIKENGTNPFEKKNDTIIKLKGHARISARNVKMSSPVIEIYGEDGHLAYARGPVEIVDTRNATRITADEALFIRSENRAVLRGNAKLVTQLKDRKGSKEKIQLTAQELERNFETSMSIARGNVVATGRSAILYAQSAEFLETQELVRSEDSPRIFSNADIFLADKIQWDLRRNTSEFRGNVRAYFSRPDDDDRRKKPVESAVHAEEGTLQKDDSLPFGQKLTLRRRVSLDRKSYSAYSDVAEVFGAGAELVRASDNVTLINREENTWSYGDTFEWIKATGAMVLSGRKQNRTRTVFYDKKSRPTAEIFATTLTRATEKANPQARGDVSIVQFSSDSSATPIKMGSEWAELQRDRKVILLHGSPYVEGEMGRIRAREIILHYEEQRYEMLGILPGLVEKRMLP